MSSHEVKEAPQEREVKPPPIVMPPSILKTKEGFLNYNSIYGIIYIFCNIIYMVKYYFSSSSRSNVYSVATYGD